MILEKKFFLIELMIDFYLSLTLLLILSLDLLISLNLPDVASFGLRLCGFKPPSETPKLTRQSFKSFDLPEFYDMFIVDGNKLRVANQFKTCTIGHFHCFTRLLLVPPYCLPSSPPAFPRLFPSPLFIHDIFFYHCSLLCL